MRRRYKREPVVEAVCDIRFASTQPWDLTIPGLLFRELGADFPILEQSTLVQVGIDLQGNQVTQQFPSVRFLTPAKTEVVQVATHALSIHQLRPYSSWQHFRERISSVLNAYRSISNSPSELTRLSLRYVNRVEIPGMQLELDDYFRIMPRAPESVPQTFQTFLTQIQIPYGPDSTSPESWLKVSFGSAVPERPDHFAFMLDLDMFTPDGQPPSMDEALGWLDVTHDRIEQAFDGAFTEKTHKEVFDEADS